MSTCERAGKDYRLQISNFSLCFLGVVVAFNIYDLDKDGYISNGELFLCLKIMSGEHLEDTQLQVSTASANVRSAKQSKIYLTSLFP